jgi:hypothetical protein
MFTDHSVRRYPLLPIPAVYVSFDHNQTVLSDWFGIWHIKL